MLETSLQKRIEILIEPLRLAPYQSKKVKVFFEYKEPGDLIYPGVLKSKANLTLDTVYDLLEELRKEMYLEVEYELICPRCHHKRGIYLNALTDWPTSSTCDSCNEEINPLTDSIVLYKVLDTTHDV